jgi:hypothetical protein
VFSKQVIVHYKFVVRSLAERQDLALRYEAVRAGAGYGPYQAYTLPELALERLDVRSVADGIGLS